MEDLSLELARVREQNTALEKQMQQLLSINSQLRESNLLLEGKCETLLEDLSVKEAQWSEKEDRLTTEVSACLLHRVGGTYKVLLLPTLNAGLPKGLEWTFVVSVTNLCF